MKTIFSIPWQKYTAIAAVSWQAGFVYRLNFTMWRVRQFIQLLTLFFLWSAVLADQAQIFSYSPQELLTYVLLGQLVRAIVLSSRSIDAQGEISSGDLNNYLIKPLNYFFFWISRDIADKALNILFSIAEIFLLFLLFQPDFYFQTQPLQLTLFIIFLFLAATLYFMFSFIISMTTFWFYENNGWGQRFLSFVLIESLAGGLFPLDIIPGYFGQIIQYLPTAYFIYLPLQIYLGRIPLNQLPLHFVVLLFWIVALYLIGQFLWRRGLKIYAAFGR